MNASPRKGHDETPNRKQEDGKSNNGTIPTLFKMLIYLPIATEIILERNVKMSTVPISVQ